MAVTDEKHTSHSYTDPKEHHHLHLLNHTNFYKFLLIMEKSLLKFGR